MRKFIMLLVLLLLVGCQYFEKKNTSSESEKSKILTDTIPEYEKSDTPKIKKYVIDRQGTQLKAKPETNSENQEHLEYGHLLEIEGEEGDYYKVINYHTGNYAYVLKSKLGNSNQISLTDSDLNMVHLIGKNKWKEPTFFENSVALDTLISLELIGKSTYEKARKSAIGFLLRDTLAIVKKDNTITLPCLDSVIVFKDVNPDTDMDNQQVFKYEGQIEFLNRFVISGNYWEAYEYILIDKKTGEEISFADFPYISPDKKYIICIYTNPYDSNSDLHLYTIDDNLQIKQILLASFVNWMAYNENEEKAFWGSDNCFYISVNHPAKFWDEGGNYNAVPQYMRIKIKK